MTPKPVPEPTSLLQTLLALAGGVGLAMKYKTSKESKGNPNI